MEELTLSIGYKMLVNTIGKCYADIVYDIAATNNRNKVYIPIYSNGSTGRLKKALPDKVFKKLVKHFGGQRLYLQKENLKVDTTNLRKKATQDLVAKGYTAEEIAEIIGVTKKTVFEKYADIEKKKVSVTSRQISLF